VGPDGSLFTGQFSPAADSTDTVAIRQVHADGSVTRFIADPYVAKPSGVAYDPVQRRLFVADAGNIMRYGVLVFPVPR
jgi:sugar lactone lactonase YvrE